MVFWTRRSSYFIMLRYHGILQVTLGSIYGHGEPQMVSTGGNNSMKSRKWSQNSV